jgi:hypothetical protein
MAPQGDVREATYLFDTAETALAFSSFGPVGPELSLLAWRGCLPAPAGLIGLAAN